MPLLTNSLQPLLGSEVIVTRPKHSAKGMVSSLTTLGAMVIEAPLIEIVPPPQPKALKKRLLHLVNSAELDVDWLLLTSVNAARITLDTLGEISLTEGNRILQNLINRGLKIACVGEKTSHYLTQRSIEVAVTPKHYVAEGLFEALSNEQLRGIKILFPRALKAREWLIEQLFAQGADVELIPAYQTLSKALPEDLKQKLRTPPVKGMKRFLTFTSDSTAKALLKQWEEDGQIETNRPLNQQSILCHAQVCVIGPSVARYLTQQGIKIDAIADPHTVEGMIQALIHLMGSNEMI